MGIYLCILVYGSVCVCVCVLGGNGLWPYVYVCECVLGGNGLWPYVYVCECVLGGNGFKCNRFITSLFVFVVKLL